MSDTLGRPPQTYIRSGRIFNRYHSSRARKILHSIRATKSGRTAIRQYRLRGNYRVLKLWVTDMFRR